jgi:hypothetical protein
MNDCLKSLSSERGGSRTTLRRSRAGFDSWRGRFESKMRPDQRLAASRPHARRLATCVPYVGSDRKPCQREVSSVVEHQTVNLAVTGSTPVPTPRAQKARYKGGPREAGQRAISHRLPRLSVLPIDMRRPEWRHARVPCSAWIPIQPAFGKRRRMSGDLQWEAPHLQLAGRNLPCHRWFCRNLSSTPHSYV